MELLKVWALRGPNVWARCPVLEVAVDLGCLRGFSPGGSPGFIDRLLGWLPSLSDTPGGFGERLRDGTGLADILERVALELQALAGSDVRFGRARAEPSGAWAVVVEYEYEELARACLDVARALCLAAVEGRPFDSAGAVERLRDLEHRLRPGHGTRAIIRAARARGLPVEPLGPPLENLLQLGYGARQRRVSNARTDRTGPIAQAISQDKELTRRLLREAGIPVPEGRPVADADDAWEAAQATGLPVVVKPRDQDNGRGVALNLQTRDEVRAGYLEARRESPNVLVERQAPGWHHRVVVIGGRLVAAARREPPQVVGDGAHTVGALIERVNADPRRGPRGPLYPIRVDDTAHAVLAEQGYTLASVPPAGRRVLVRRLPHVQDGATVADVTDRVHPEVAARVLDAARIVGLDLAGIDVVAEDIAHPLEAQGGVVLEVNDTPALGQHVPPLCDPGRPIGETVVDLLFPRGEGARIPIAVVTGAGSAAVVRLVARVLGGAGRRVGVACSGGVYLGDRLVRPPDGPETEAVRAVLRNPSVEAAVLEATGAGIRREGLGFDRCDVAVVTGAGAGAPERVAVASVAREGTAVLNAEDPEAVGLAEHCPGSVVTFARDPDHPVLAEHRAGGGRVAFVRSGSIVLAEGEREESLGPPGGSAEDEPGVEGVLAAAAACRALGLPTALIAAGLRSVRGGARATARPAAHGRVVGRW
jgi:cyanophycin synthetase